MPPLKPLRAYQGHSKEVINCEDSQVSLYYKVCKRVHTDRIEDVN